MGGAAASGIATAGAVGASAAVGATVAGFVTKENVEKVREMYRKSFRKGTKTGRAEKSRESDMLGAELIEVEMTCRFHYSYVVNLRM